MRGSIPITLTFDPNNSKPFTCFKFKRRCPIRYFYIPIECPFMLGCRDGFCPLSHTVFEVIFHPILHKTKHCSLSEKGGCKFEKKCAFYHNEDDRLASYFSWLVWQKNWEMYPKNVRPMLLKYGLSDKVMSKVLLMVNLRMTAKGISTVFTNGTDCIKRLEDQLNELITSCEGSSEMEEGLVNF